MSERRMDGMTAILAHRAGRGKALAAVVIAVLLIGCATPRREFTSRHMGTTFRIVAYAASEARARDAAMAAFARVAALDETLSDWKPESELSRLTRQAVRCDVPVSSDLFEVLGAALRVARLSDGAFDPTVGPYVRLWRRSRRQRAAPSPQRLAEARRRVGFRLVVLDEDRRTARLLASGMHLDLGGIAKGYAAREALRIVRSFGIERALVDAGGDLAVGAPPPKRAGWRIALPPGHLAGPPLGFVDVADAGVATTGDAFQAVVVDGRRWAHVIDPRTGLGVADTATATAIHRDPMIADALASAAAVLEARAALALADRLGGALLLVRPREDGAGVLRSGRFPPLRGPPSGRVLR